MSAPRAEIFVCLDAINTKDPTYKYDRKKVSAYALMLWLSLSKENMPCIDKINERLFSMPDNLVYVALYAGIPKGKKFVRWPKGKKDKDKEASKKEESLIQLLMEEHGFSDFEARTLFTRYIRD